MSYCKLPHLISGTCYCYLINLTKEVTGLMKKTKDMQLKWYVFLLCIVVWEIDVQIVFPFSFIIISSPYRISLWNYGLLKRGVFCLYFNDAWLIKGTEFWDNFILTMMPVSSIWKSWLCCTNQLHKILILWISIDIFHLGWFHLYYIIVILYLNKVISV